MEISRRKIKNTNTFRSLSRIIRSMLLNKTNVNAINSGFIKSQEIGFDKWQMDTNSSGNNKNIIKELIKKQALKW